MPRFYCPIPLRRHDSVDLPAAAARHVQVLRLQPGDALTLFNGEGGEFDACVEHMGRTQVRVQVREHHAHEREMAQPVHLLSCIPANERMDWLVEKATELGVCSIWPVLSAHSVVRLKGERAEKKVAHWQSVAIAACEQCGRNRVPVIHPIQEFSPLLQGGGFIASTAASPAQRWLLSLHPEARTVRERHADALAMPPSPLWVLHGPEGGLNPQEQALAIAHGFAPVSLGARVLRAETAPLAVLAALGAWG